MILVSHQAGWYSSNALGLYCTRCIRFESRLSWL